MNRKTAKLLRGLARDSGIQERVIKRAWYALPASAKPGARAAIAALARVVRGKPGDIPAAETPRLAARVATALTCRPPMPRIARKRLAESDRRARKARGRMRRDEKASAGT